MSRAESIKHTIKHEPRVNQTETRKEILNEMIEVVKKTPFEAKVDFNCGLGLTDYYQGIKRELLTKHQQLLNNYRQSEIEINNHNNLTLILADLRKDISLIDSIWTSDIQEMTYYQKIALTTCQHLLKNEEIN